MSIRIRDARPEDKDAIRAFTQDNRNWGDYVAGELDGWLKVNDGVLRVVEDDTGRIVAIQHYQTLNGTQVWLSGLRVRPDRRGQGLARALLDDAIRMARSERVLTLRYASEAVNDTMQRLSQEYHLRPRGTWLSFERRMDADACAIGRSRGTLDETVTPLGPRDRLRALSLLHTTGRTLYVQDWTWRSIDDHALSELIRDQRGYIVRSGMGGWSLALVGKQAEAEIEVTLYGTDAACALALLEHLQRMACATHDGVLMSVHAPQDSPAAGLLASLVGRGEWHPKTEQPLRVWELDLIV
jgi:GNAT superfamily N-acetyltransferase